MPEVTMAELTAFCLDEWRLRIGDRPLSENELKTQMKEVAGSTKAAFAGCVLIDAPSTKGGRSMVLLPPND